MEKDYQKQLEAFAFPDSYSVAEDYLAKYWLQKNEYLEKVKAIKDTIFNPDAKDLPDMMPEDTFQLIPLAGGLIFAREDFELLKECFEETGDKYFFILENYDEDNPPHTSGPPLRLKYPVSITWDALISGDGISYELFQRPIRNYFVFGDSANWGKYVANDTEFYPFDILGFIQNFDPIFRKKFKLKSEKERHNLEKWLPSVYKKYL